MGIVELRRCLQKLSRVIPSNGFSASCNVLTGCNAASIDALIPTTFFTVGSSPPSKLVMVFGLSDASIPREIIFVIVPAFYPKLLQVSLQFSIHHHPHGMSGARGRLIGCHLGKKTFHFGRWWKR